MRSRRTTMGALALTLAAMTIGYFIGVSFQEPQVAQAAGGKAKSRTGIAPDKKEQGLK